MKIINKLLALSVLAFVCVTGAAAQAPTGAQQPNSGWLQESTGVPWQIAGVYTFNASSPPTGGFNVLGMRYFQLVFVPTGTVATCGVSFDSSTNAGSSFTTGGVFSSGTIGSCASPGVYTNSSASTPTSTGQLTPTITGSGTVTVTLYGYINNPGAAGSSNAAITSPLDGSGYVNMDCKAGCTGGNANGQATMANSAPVVVSSNQSAIPVSGTVTVNGTVTANQGTVTDTAPATATVTAQDIVSTSTGVANGGAFITGTPTAGSAASFALASGFEDINFQVTGAWTGTLAVEASIDGGTTWVSAGLHQQGTTYFTASFTQNFIGEHNAAGYTNVRVRATAAWTGTATVKIVQSVNPRVFYVANPIGIQDGVTKSILNTVKPASTAAVAADTAVVVAVSPNNSVTVANSQTPEATAAWTNATTVNTALAQTVTGYGSTIVTLNQGTTLTGGVVTFEASDTVAGTNWYPVQAVQTNGFLVGSTYALVASTNQGWDVDVAGWIQFRLRLSTVITGTGTVNVGIATNASSSVSDISDGIVSWGSGILGAPSNYGTSPGAVLVPGVNANVTAQPAAVQGNAGTNAQAWWEQIGDATHGPVAVKAASTAAAATDPSLVVQLNPAQPNLTTPLNVALAANQSVNVAQIGGTAPVIDPCAANAGSAAVINLAAGGQVITGTAAKQTYICALDLVTATAQNIALVEGTGTTCATSIAGMAGGSTAATGWNFAANGGLVKGSGGNWVYKTATLADNVCLLLSSTGQTSGEIRYVQQ